MTFTALTAGEFHTCGITSDGTAHCWGHNRNGQSDVPDGVTFTTLTAGGYHTCGITSNGTAHCWGSNGYGQSDVPNGLTFTTIAASVLHTCGITSDGATLCWGHHGFGQSDVPDGLTFTALTAGDFYTCGITSNGTAHCWGDNRNGQSDVPDGLTFTALTAGEIHTCGITSNGTAHCWGDNRNGQLDVPGGVRFGDDVFSPTITSSLDRVANPAGWHNAPVTITYTCTDWMGVDSCPGPFTVTEDGADQQVTATAVDTAGNATTIVDTINLDTNAPTTTLTPHIAGSTLSGTITDTLSGPASVTVVITPVLGTGTARVGATVDCGDEAGIVALALAQQDTACGWTADVPAGIWHIALTGGDVAGNIEDPHDVGTVVITP